MDKEIDDAEASIHYMIAALRERHQRELQPWLDQLSLIASMRGPPPIVIPLTQIAGSNRWLDAT